MQEARTASAFHHPNIAHIYDIDQAEIFPAHIHVRAAGALPRVTHFIAMEYVSGTTLAEIISGKRLDLHNTLRFAVQISDVLAAAHKTGIIHRDLKPGNIMVDENGVVKVLDFGLAKLIDLVPNPDGPTQSMQGTTHQGVIQGTLPYMSPEQVQGKKLNARSDIFSFGAVLYEMMSGRQAFQGESSLLTMSAVLRETPSPLQILRPKLPSQVVRVVSRCLQKNPDLRYPSGAELLKDLRACQSRFVARETGLRAIARRPRIIVPAAILAVVLAVAFTLLTVRRSRISWAKTQALPEVSRLIDQEKYSAAFALASRAAEYVPNDSELAKLWPDMSWTISVRTTPEGADVYRKDYDAADSAWEYWGKTPLRNIRIPAGPHARWKFKKQGYDEIERTTASVLEERDSVYSLSVDLVGKGKGPPGMVKVALGNLPARLTFGGYQDLPKVRLGDFWLDKYEVTNRQYREFLRRGGYERQEYWKNAFRMNGRPLSWDKAMSFLRDSTGRRGPAGWVQGEYPQGQDDFPVTGVSWYEAAAYADFVGKALPTIYHWDRAAAIWTSDSVVPLSNFRGYGPARVGSYRGMSPYGTYDMAGNVKEWCWNEAGSDKRYILGGAWNEPTYQFAEADARPSFDRDPTFGFRCAKDASPVPNALLVPVTRSARDYSRERPASDQLFRAYRSLYSYDKAPLKATVESIIDKEEYWKREKITFVAAYGNERVIAYLFLPKKSTPPFQAVIYFPGSNSIQIHSSSDLSPDFLDFILKSGRALVWPVYKGTFERRDDLKSDNPETTSRYRDHVIAWSKDLGRSIDYLETRPDIDQDKLAYFGYSWGGEMGALLPAIETRLKTCVLFVGGFSRLKTLPEVDQINFAPHVKQPVLLLSGRYDFILPVETSQMPMFRLLAAPKEDKRHMLYDTGHSIPHSALIKETLDWLDRYLGAVKTTP